MADTGPSQSSAGSVPHTSVAPAPRHSHIHFPVSTSDSNRPDPSNALADTSTSTSLLPCKSQVSATNVFPDKRRFSVDGGNTRAERARSTTMPSAISVAPRTVKSSAVIVQEPAVDRGHVSLDLDFAHTFSEEYDLSQDDSKIFQDVENALRVKARRESRLQSPASHPTLNVGSNSDIGSLLSAGSSVRDSLPSHPPTLPSSVPFRNNTSEIDFSPSTRITPPHPVPTSVNGGKTLDWTGSVVEVERSHRRWTLSVGKRKGSDNAPLTKVANIQQQQAEYAEKVSRIKATASSHTLRKALITSQQLQRRYSIVFGSLSSDTGRLNLAKVARWYAAQEQTVRASLVKAEPLSWLRHLEKRGVKTPTRFPRRLSALIVEEFIRSQNKQQIMATIPEDPFLPMPSSTAPQSLQAAKSPSNPYGRPSSSRTSVGPTTGRRSLEGRWSPEFGIDSPQASPDIEPPRPRRPRANSPGNSVRSSASGSSNHPISARVPLSSLASNRLYVRRSAYGARRHAEDSDDGFSSARNSDGHSDDGDIERRIKTQPRRAHLGLRDHPRSRNDISLSDKQQEGAEEKKYNLESTFAGNTLSMGTVSEDEPTARPREVGQRSSLTTVPRAVGSRIVRLSLPDADHLLVEHEQQRQREVDEDLLNHDYEIRAQMLENVEAQNHRIRQLLHRVAGGLKDYEVLQSTLTKSLGLPHRSLSPELLDAFSHDPASVVGATRRFRGWRAVEYIQTRLQKQRQTFRSFLLDAEESGIFSTLDSIFDDPIIALQQTLDELESHRQCIASKAKDVADALTKVKATHGTVKSQYRSTLSHTSVVYPELSHIVALEESYKDQYQQFWEFGMDVLTFVLDSVTPFWRAYGKRIGEDVQDFLVIPLYRNEFTGEAKRYPIERLPKRSFRHWVGLLLFFFSTVGITMLQGRAALTSTIHYRMQWIPETYNGFRYTAMPFFWVIILIQWCAVIMEFSVVFAQLAVTTWWLGWFLRLNT